MAYWPTEQSALGSAQLPTVSDSVKATQLTAEVTTFHNSYISAHRSTERSTLTAAQLSAFCGSVKATNLASQRAAIFTTF